MFGDFIASAAADADSLRSFAPSRKRNREKESLTHLSVDFGFESLDPP